MMLFGCNPGSPVTRRSDTEGGNETTPLTIRSYRFPNRSILESGRSKCPAVEHLHEWVVLDAKREIHPSAPS